MDDKRGKALAAGMALMLAAALAVPAPLSAQGFDRPHQGFERLRPPGGFGGGGRPDRFEPSVIVDVDALGLIDGWWSRPPESGGASSATVMSSGAQLLFFCRASEALYVTFEPAYGDPAGAAPQGFGCAAGEGLFALDQGGLSCRPHGAYPSTGAVEPTAITIDDPAAGGRTLFGDCVGPDGSVAPALVAPELAAASAGPGPAEAAPCNRSTVTFRGRVTAGGC